MRVRVLGYIVWVLVICLPSGAAWADRPAAETDILRGNTAYFDGDYLGAEKWYGAAASNDPTWALSLNNRGLARFHQGNYSGAEADFDAAKALDASYVSPYVNKGKCLIAQQQFTNAIAELQAGLAIDSDRPSLLYNLGWAYDEAGNTTNAISRYTFALAADSTYHRARLARGVALAKQGDTSSAIEDFYEVIRSATDSDMLAGIAAYNLQLLRGSGVNFDSTPAATDYQEGLFLFSVQRYQEAMDKFRSARSNETDVAEIPWMAGWTATRQRNEALANSFFSQAAALLPLVTVEPVSGSPTVYFDGLGRGEAPATVFLFPSEYDVALRETVGSDNREWIGRAYTDGTPGGTSNMVMNTATVTAYTAFGPVTDSDRDWLKDSWETNWYGNLAQGPGSQQTDFDGLSALQEHWLLTSPHTHDTDGDGVDDDEELERYETDPAFSNRFFYVNDSSSSNDNWCDAAGSDVNDGLYLTSPKASVQAILSSYDLGAGDVVLIDTGDYALTNSVTVTSSDGGALGNPVIFLGSPYGVRFRRDSAASVSSGWNFDSSGATKLTTASSGRHSSVPIRFMQISGFTKGIYVRGFGGVSLECINISSNSTYGIDSDYVNGGLSEPGLIRNCLIHDNGTYGIYLFDSPVHVESCTLANNATGLHNALGGEPYQVARNNIFHASGSEARCVYARELDLQELDSDHNCFHAENGAALVAIQGSGSFFDLQSYSELTGREAHSIACDPLFANSGAGDYHLQSTGGSYHDGVWTPDASNSPAIDAAALWVAWSEEPPPNGQRADLGAYGNTAQASLSPTDRTLVLTAPGMGVPHLDTAVPLAVVWTRGGSGWQSNDTVRLEYSLDDGASWTDIVDALSVLASRDFFDWDVTGIKSPVARIRITANQDAMAVATTDYRVRIGPEIAFYVNDASTLNDEWCTAQGDVLNSGLTPASPKVSVQAILDEYNLEAGDRVRIDTGSYNLSQNTTITSTDGGSALGQVVFEASPYGVVIDRGSTSGTYVWLINADFISLTTADSTKYPSVPQRYMQVTGGGYGVFCENQFADIQRVDSVGNRTGIHIGDYLVSVKNCLSRDNLTDGVAVNFSEATVENCTIFGNREAGIDSYGSVGCSFKNNIIVAQGEGSTAVYLRSLPEVSDYNNLYSTDGALLGYYSGDKTTLAALRSATGKDANSISVDPLLANPASGNLHLRSIEGRYDSSGTWTKDTRQSPCIDGGDPSVAWTEEPEPNGGRANMGAFGNMLQASKSLTNTAYSLTILSEHGSADPPPAVHTFYEDSFVACSVSSEEVVGNLRYLSTGWALSDHADTNGNVVGGAPHVGLVMTNDALLSWLWSTNDWVDYYEWSTIAQTQYVAVPFPVTVTARDVHGATVTGFTGSGGLSAWLDFETTGTVFGSTSHDNAASSSYTRGIQITPSNDLTVTHVRHYWGSKVSIWTDGGDLLASTAVTSSPGTWVETALEESVLLTAGETYRIGAYGSTYYYSYSSPPFSFADGTVLANCYQSGDGFPSALTTTYSYFVDVRYTVGPLDSAAASPASIGSFVGGVWTGDVSVLEGGTNVYLRVEDANGRTGDSAVFIVCYVPKGTPLSWLNAYGLTNDPCNFVEWDDPDGDGHLTWEEYIADTIPTDGQSYLGITGLVHTVDGIQVMWKGGTNVWQRLESREDLMATNAPWVAVFTNPPPTSGTTNYLHQGTTNRVLYYRLKAWR